MSDGKGIIIEFVGPPGSGKTTSCKVFAEQSRRRGLTVLERDDLKNYINDIGKIRIVLLSIKTAFVKGPLVLYFISLLAFNRIFSSDSIYRFLKLSFYDMALKELRRASKFDMIILDQWIIQEIWSATIFKRTNYFKLLKHMRYFYFKTDAVIFFKADAVTTSSRISRRQNGLSRFDKMTPSVRIHQIRKYSLYLFQLYSISTCSHKYILPADKLPSKNAPLFISSLNAFFGERSASENVIHS